SWALLALVGDLDLAAEVRQPGGVLALAAREEREERRGLALRRVPLFEADGALQSDPVEAKLLGRAVLETLGRVAGGRRRVVVAGHAETGLGFAVEADRGDAVLGVEGAALFLLRRQVDACRGGDRRLDGR